jgi:2-oxoglutarate dehydrogenase E2 component (dihydrolipoamide succinyltransferase)
MEHKVVIPSTADGAHEVTITAWFRSPGERVQKGKDLVEAVTEKITLYVPAPVNGILKQILAPQGDKVRVGDVVGIVTATQEEH